MLKLRLGSRRRSPLARLSAIIAAAAIAALAVETQTALANTGTVYWDANNNAAAGNSFFSGSLSGSGNVGLGANVMPSLTSGLRQCRRRHVGAPSNASGTRNTATGFDSLRFSTGDFNTATGYDALRMSTGDDNTAFGADALANNTSGRRNTATGSADVAGKQHRRSQRGDRLPGARRLRSDAQGQRQRRDRL